MSRDKIWTKTLLVAVLAIAFSGMSQAQNHASNPYDTIDDWAKLPPGRVWGATSAMQPGDIVEIEVEGVGILRNPVVAEK